MEALDILLVEQTLALARVLLAGAEPVKAYDLCTKTAPILALQHPKVKAFAALLRTHIDQYFDDEAYQRRYSGYKNGVKIEVTPFCDQPLLSLVRAQIPRAIINQQAKKDPDRRINVLAIGSWDCTLERAVLEDNANVDLVISELADSGNDAVAALKDLFPGRVSVTGRFDVGDIHEEAIFDVAMALEVVEHVTDDVHFLRNIRQRMKPDGIVVLSTPNAADWYEEKLVDDFDAAARGERENWYHHVRAYTPQTLNKALLEARLIGNVRNTQGCLVAVTNPMPEDKEFYLSETAVETFSTIADFKPGTTVYSRVAVNDGQFPVHVINGICLMPWHLRPKGTQ